MLSRVLALMLILTVTFLATSDTLPAQSDYSRFVGGRAVIRSHLFDFGKVPQQAVVCKKFYVVNEGTDTLEILKVKPGCGCTKAPLSKSLVAVGDSAEIEIKFSSGPRKGKWAKSTDVFTSDRLAGVQKLRFSAYVYPDGAATTPFLLKPQKLDLVTADLESGELSVKMRNITDVPLSVTLVSFDDEFMSVEIPSGEIAPGQDELVRIKVKSDRPNIMFHKSITLEINDAEHTRLSIPVSVQGKNRPSGGDESS